MAHDEARDLRDERKEKRSGGGSRADRAERAKEAEKLADQRSVIPGPRSHGGTTRVSVEGEQTRDHTSRRGPGPHDDVQLSDRVAPDVADDIERKD
jgi:hypothetical protein